MLTITTVNVNGLRAALRKGMTEWLAERRPDVLLLQEVRAPDELVHELLGAEWDVVHQEAAFKGRAGVAVASRLPMRGARIGIGSDLDTDSGRWVEADLELPGGGDLPGGGLLTVVSVYVHSGEAGAPKQDDKYAFLERATTRLGELQNAGGLALVGGDLNIAHREVDIKNWKGNLKTAGFLPRERAYLDRWFGELRWVDLGRRLGGEGPGPYTWWSMRGKAFDNDAGWRLDYQLATPELADAAVSAVIDRAPSWDTRWTDHAPLTVTFDL